MSETELHCIFHQSLQSRIVLRTPNFFSYILETNGSFPTTRFITDGAIHVLEKSEILPCRMNISAGLILEKDGVYCYFHPGVNSTIASIVILNMSVNMSTMIYKEINGQDFMNHMKNYKSHLGSNWTLVSICSLLYTVYKIK